MKVTLCLAILALLVPVAFGQEKPVDGTERSPLQESAEFKKDLERMKKDKPEEYKKLAMDMTHIIQMLLGRLGYGLGPFTGVFDESTRTAVRKYQMKNGLPLTGDVLDLQLLEQSKKDWDVLDAAPLSLPFKSVQVSTWDDGYVSAKGTWRLIGSEIASPEQSSEITCLKDRGLCIEAKAYISSSFRGLYVDMELYDIERWDKSEVVTKPNESLCTRFTLRINKVQGTVSGTRSTVSKEKNL